MASFGACLLSLTLICAIIAGTSEFVQLKCNDNNNGRFGQQSLLECILILSEEATDVQINRIIWKKNGAETALRLDYKRGSTLKSEPRFTLAQRYNIHFDVSMLVTNTLMADRGNYTCIVETNRGFCKSSAPRLRLSVPYSTPKINRSRNPNQNVAMTLSCTATGGYPEGKILWFDEYGTDWSPSSQQEAIKTTDGRLNLVSKLDLLSGSSFSTYTCAVHNNRGEREGETQYNVSDLDPQSVRHEGKTQKSDLASKIVIPVVIIGSVIIGLLIVRLLKPHCQSSHQALPTNNDCGYEDELQTKTKPEGEYSSCVTPQPSNTTLSCIFH
ncbi:butyrophilin subfamily 2 member A2 [Gadus morhua]|uniref:butyrophilin subfamily 2 member A2 n=1 Tax=Gadus morhua TaxID=8049 RepID=UPI0011B84346|nr:butyrophilin subfamily 2 member A2-like [Gadus morhua]XP_030207154.1 butyrophilin subfamily 2 member A2-like [Gadus morhua]